MSQGRLNQVLDQFRRDRRPFVQSIADLASRPENAEHLQNAEILSFLRHLMMDVDPRIQQTAALAVGHLAEQGLAQAVVKEDILPRLVQSMASQNRSYKKAASFVLRAVAKHSPELSQAVVGCGGVEALVLCLEGFDPRVKEEAAWALGCIARHNETLSQSVVEAGAAHLLVLCLQEPEMSLKSIAASTIRDICKHTRELAQTMVDAGAITLLARWALSRDAKLKVECHQTLVTLMKANEIAETCQRQVFSALSSISKHSAGLAEMVIEAEIFPAAVALLRDPDEYVRKNVATLMQEVVKHSLELSEVIVNSGALAPVIYYLAGCRGGLRLPAIVMLGYLATHSESLAMAVIRSKGVFQLALCLSEESEQKIQAATVWSIGQIGQHTPDHAEAVATANLLPKLLQLYMDASSSKELQVQSQKALQSILPKCTCVAALEPLLHDAPSNILKLVLCQFSKVLPDDSKARRLFVTSGGLKMVQEIEAEPDSALEEYINTIKNSFPEEIVSSTGSTPLTTQMLQQGV